MWLLSFSLTIVPVGVIRKVEPINKASGSHCLFTLIPMLSNCS